MTAALLAAVYVIGSSFMNDARPQALDVSLWHIDCGKSLEFIFDNPAMPCLGTSTIWPEALAGSQFSHVAFQPLEGTQAAELDAIRTWLDLQPAALAVIHPTWPEPADWEADHHGNGPRSAAYYDDLTAKIDRPVISNRVNEMLDFIFHDPGAVVPFATMFRDATGHADFTVGRYLHHNAMRRAFAQPTGVDPSGTLTQAQMDYLDGVIAAHPPRLRVAVTALGVSWEPWGYESWNLYRGDLNVLRASGAYSQDKFCGLASPTFSDATLPASGGALFYLATGVSAGQESELGYGRSNGSPCP